MARLDAAPEITSSLFRDFPLGRSLGRDGRGITMISRGTRDTPCASKFSIAQEVSIIPRRSSIASAFATLSRSFRMIFDGDNVKFLYILSYFWDFFFLILPKMEEKFRREICEKMERVKLKLRWRIDTILYLGERC